MFLRYIGVCGVCVYAQGWFMTSTCTYVQNDWQRDRQSQKHVYSWEEPGSQVVHTAMVWKGPVNRGAVGDSALRGKQERPEALHEWASS